MNKSIEDFKAEALMARENMMASFREATNGLMDLAMVFPEFGFNETSQEVFRTKTEPVSIHFTGWMRTESRYDLYLIGINPLGERKEVHWENVDQEDMVHLYAYVTTVLSMGKEIN